MISAETILNHLKEPIFLVDKEARILFYNKASNRLRTLARKPIETGVSVLDLVSADRQDIVRMLLQQTFQHHITETVEAEYADLDGRPHYFEVTYSPLPYKDDMHACIEVRDITPQKTFERKSVRLLRDYQNVLENANALIFSVDSREYITDWNKECTRITHFEKNEILAQRVAKLADEKNRESMAILMAKVLSGMPVNNYELVISDKDHEQLTLLVNVTPKFNDKNDVVGALFVGQDITELSTYRFSLEQQVLDRTEKLKEALEKERELVALKDRFVSMASHELRTPLSSIEHSVRHIRSTCSLPHDEFGALDKIEFQVGLMRNLLEDILTLEKGNVQKLKASYQSFDLIHFLDELAEEVLISRQHSHRIEKRLSHPSIGMVCDNKLLRNIFINLLNNAMKFSPDSDKVLLFITRNDDETVDVVVQDDGIGIPEADLKRIFDPFTRGSNAGSITGTGLGLSIVKRAVETLQGKLLFESAVGKGTKVTVQLACSPDSV